MMELKIHIGLQLLKDLIFLLHVARHLGSDVAVVQEELLALSLEQN